MTRLIILGSTGSIGRQALEVVDTLAGQIEIVGLGARRDAQTLAAQARRHRPRAVALAEASGVEALRGAVAPGTEIFTGDDALQRLAAAGDADIVLVAVVGVAGL